MPRPYDMYKRPERSTFSNTAVNVDLVRRIPHKNKHVGANPISGTNLIAPWRNRSATDFESIGSCATHGEATNF
jgi:hypothetical protein